MDETLRRRLVGAAFLLIVAFVLASLLPRRPEGPAAVDADVVTINLREPEVIYDQATVIGTPAEDTAAPTTDETESDDAAPELADPSTVAVAPGPSAPQPTARPTPKPSPKPTALPTPAPKPTPKPTPKPVPSPVPSAPPMQTPSAAATPQQWWVQLGSFSDIENARQVETKLKTLGQAVVIAPIATTKGTLYRVRSGPFSSSGAAETAHRAVVTAGYKDARIITP
ncbi:hypothetical protein E4T66_08475 [Sinimarinibacterium sp. CAU 1509]|uniref:SPOR domain-containing protein n=1 Tax=Sinimarinibacterium sp. CAU 1509 TaxID=2562283 RepID=UPI0010ACD4A7|nr:SPOR domain-containing protein [Sinimarinibacterium sp. CAU 1509]TJY62246.1 hypothetical protein E4T66_08475 [Sinimarinibacterium sp. CAU 1509]